MRALSERRGLMPAAWAIVGVLILSLLLRKGLAEWRELDQWRVLAASAVGLQRGAEWTAEQLQQSARARQIVLSEVQSVDSGWQLRGRVSGERVLREWLLALQREGRQPLQWGLEQADSGLSFDLVLAR